ncbi:hypothetical protein TrST_g14303 [Triparma strigata]|uniref:Uncharacterized protein n=1 Tax=Triparma strigata TaxID=1606541 RepID=A0A9W6ZY75_9STRA|nr:hypothetical protein TrST_g14303 [Triparma strigata]
MSADRRTSSSTTSSFTTTLYPFLISITSLVCSLSPLPPSKAPSTPNPLLTLTQIPDATLSLKTGATTVNQWLDNYSTQVFLDPNEERVLTVKHTLHTQNGEDRVTGVFQVEYKNYEEGEEGVRGETWKASMNVLLRIILCYLGSTTSRLASDRCSLWRSLERREKNPHAQPNLKTLEGWIEVELSFERKREENEEGYECRAFRWCKGPTGRVQVKHWDLDRKFLEEMPGKEGVPGIEVNIVEDYILKESQQEKETQARELQQQLDLEKQRQQHQIQVQQQQQQQQQLHYLHHQQQQPQQNFHPLHTQPPPQQQHPRSRRHTVDGNPTFSNLSTSPGQSFLQQHQNLNNPLSQMSGLAQALMNDQVANPSSNPNVNPSGNNPQIQQQQQQHRRSFDAGQGPPDLHRGHSRSFDAHYAYAPQTANFNYPPPSSLSQSPNTLQMFSHLSQTPPLSNPINMPIKSPNERNLSNEGTGSPLPPLHPGSAPRSAGRSDIYNSGGLASLGFGGSNVNPVSSPPPSHHPSPDDASFTKDSPLLSPDELTTLPPSPFTADASNSQLSSKTGTLSNLGFGGEQSTQFHVEKTYEVDVGEVSDEGLGGTLEYKGVDEGEGGLDEFREFAKGLKK